MYFPRCLFLRYFIRFRLLSMSTSQKRKKKFGRRFVASITATEEEGWRRRKTNVWDILLLLFEGKCPEEEKWIIIVL